MREFRRIVLVILLVLLIFACSLYSPRVLAQDCVPRTIVVTIGDNTPGNPMQSFTSELGCVYEVYTNLEGYEPINTEVIFSNVTYRPLNAAHYKVSGEGVIIGYQLTRLEYTQGLLYIISFEDGKFLRLNPFEFETK